MHAFELIKDGSKASGAAIVAVFGEDAYLRREALDVLVRALAGEGDRELALTRFAGDKASLADVLDELRTLPFLVRRRVVLVEDADGFVTAHRRELERLAEKPPGAGALILSVKSWPGNTRLAKLVDKVGLGVDCKSPPEAELPAWLAQLAKAREKVKLPADAASLLLELVGDEVGLLVQELAKLAVYVGERKEITREDVARMVGANRVNEIWDMLDDATTGRGARALHELDRLLHSGEHPVGLLNAMNASLRKVHHAGLLRRAKRDLVSACKEAGAWPAPKVGEQHAHLGPSRVDGLPALLLRADLDLKGGSSLSKEAIIERLVVRLVAKRQD